MNDALIPHEVVMIMIKHNVNHLGAVADLSQPITARSSGQSGISQGAISQMERSDSKPQKKR
ncbi:hypothetical protein [Glaesserella parasuis]|uniref:Uncharacterized protein n=1 Tax=Glaesserella parasuis TaxID=738 RepID=A0AAJ6DA84_GLAPU|nr:hypothetical protein [Glaesserella parasuis]WGE09989.1 hypothetical protein QBL01_12460 [Glaesserella parasuis]